MSPQNWKKLRLTSLVKCAFKPHQSKTLFHTFHDSSQSNKIWLDITFFIQNFPNHKVLRKRVASQVKNIIFIGTDISHMLV